MENSEKTEEVTRENTILIWQASRLSISIKCEKAPEILKANGTVIGTLGNFSASIGKAKSKKTFNVSAIVVAALKGGTVLLYSAELPGRIHTHHFQADAVDGRQADTHPYDTPPEQRG